MKNFSKYINSWFRIFVGLSPALIILSTFSLPSLAQSKPIILPAASDHNTPSKTKTGLVKFSFPAPLDRGAPSRTGAGGRRGSSCLMTENGQLPLTALMPTSNNQGLTVDDNPDLYVYVPQTTTQMGEFVLMDDQGNDVYKTSFIPPNQPGIVKLTIPPKTSLKTGKKYKWYFSIICNSDDRSEDEYVSGSLERTTLGSLLNSSLEQATPLKRAEIYAKNKIWYDTISNVVALRNTNPEVWLQLLESVGLEQFSKESFVDFGTPKP